MKCIFCDNENEAISVEHIIPESLGNKKYLMDKGKVCDDCNAKFSKFENKVLTKSVLAMERARFGVKTKKNKTSKGKIKDIDVEGDEKFRPTYLTVKGINSENLKNYNAKTGVGNLVVPTFDKSEVAASKFLLKVGLESIHTSQKQLFSKYDFTDLKDFLTTKANEDWPFLTTDHEISKFQSVARFTDKYLLRKINCEISFTEIDKETLLFKFKYGGVAMTINLLNRNLDWTEEIMEKDNLASLYPDRYRKKREIKEIKKR